MSWSASFFQILQSQCDPQLKKDLTPLHAIILKAFDTNLTPLDDQQNTAIDQSNLPYLIN